MFVAVLVLALAHSVSAQYGQQTPAPSACPQGMIVAPAYGTTCYNGGFYYSGVCCEAPTAPTTPAPAACPQGMITAPAYGTTCYNGGFYYSGVCCETPTVKITSVTTTNLPINPCDKVQDTSTNCPVWVQNGFCVSTFYTNAQKKQHCAKSCKLCP